MCVSSAVLSSGALLSRVAVRCLVAILVFRSICEIGCAQSVQDSEQPSSRQPQSLESRPAEDWPAFLGPTGNGRSGLQGLVVPWGEQGPRVCWATDLGEGYCGPSVAKGFAVVFDRVRGKERLRCLKAETGRVVWEKK
jgi:hypothetical protein